MQHEWTPQDFTFSNNYSRFVRNLDFVLESGPVKTALTGVSRENNGRGLRDWKNSFVYAKIIDSPPGWPHVSAAGFLFANDPFWQDHLPDLNCPLLAFVGFGREQQSAGMVKRIDWLDSFYNQILTKMPTEQWQKLLIGNNYYLVSYQCFDLWFAHPDPPKACTEYFITKLNQLRLGLKNLK